MGQKAPSGGIGRSSKSWLKYMDDDMKMVGLRKDVVQDLYKTEWR